MYLKRIVRAQLFVYTSDPVHFMIMYFPVKWIGCRALTQWCLWWFGLRHTTGYSVTRGVAISACLLAAHICALQGRQTHRGTTVLLPSFHVVYLSLCVAVTMRSYSWCWGEITTHSSKQCWLLWQGQSCGSFRNVLRLSLTEAPKTVLTSLRSLGLWFESAFCSGCF